MKPQNTTWHGIILVNMQKATIFFGDLHYYKQGFSNFPQIIYQFMKIYNLFNAFWEKPQNEHV
jgi:hypothetical protein